MFFSFNFKQNNTNDNIKILVRIWENEDSVLYNTADTKKIYITAVKIG